MSPGGQMSQTGGLRQTITTAALVHPVYGRGEVYLVPNRNIDWLYPRLGSQGSPDDFPIVDKLGK